MSVKVKYFIRISCANFPCEYKNEETSTFLFSLVSVVGHVSEMSWQWARERMTENLNLNLPPQVDYFEKSPACTPTKVLKRLDLLSADGLFVPKNGLPSPGYSTAHSSLAATPTLIRRFSKYDDETVRRKSFTPGVTYDHAISDEFAYINLTIKERRTSCNEQNSKSASSAPKKRFIYEKTNTENNKIFVAKIIGDDNEEDEIEIVDLDDDEEYHSSFKQQQAKENCYPNCDINVWLRSCEHEIVEPIEGVLIGEIPKWINGSLLRNGPGSIKVGEMTYNHLFDSAALLHRFNIVDGHVTYQCRFLKSDSYKKNLAANRIVVSEFGTCTVPDPCQSIFQRFAFILRTQKKFNQKQFISIFIFFYARVASLFKPADSNSDNAMISIYPFNDEYFAFTESPVIHKIDPITLDTLERVDLTQHIGIVNHTSHPHIMPEGTVYNVGMSVGKMGPAYNIICFPGGEGMFENASVIAEIPTRWKLHPSYMHTFGITENFFIIVEQPLTVSVPAVIKSQITNEPFISCLKWFGDKMTYIHLVDRESGELKHTFHAEAFFFLHIINQYEKDGHVVIDISCYRDPEMLNCMYIDTMRGMQNNPDYAKMFRGRPLRFVLPLNYPKKSKSMTNFFSMSFDDDTSINKTELLSNNLVKLKESSASAFAMPDGSIYCKPELLCNLGCETPRISYEKYLGTDYQYFYAISSDVDAENPGTLIKVDVTSKTCLTWCENNCYPSEPIFVPTPNSVDEDDGVILSSMVWGNGEENRVGLLVLDAKTMTELGRCEFNDLPGPVPKCLHGWFAPPKN